MSLRRRLLLGLLVLAALGMITVAFVTTALFRTFLVDRLDAQLRSTRPPPGAFRRDPTTATGTTNRPFSPTGLVVERWTATGERVASFPSESDTGGGPVLTAADFTRPSGQPFSTDAASDSAGYRVVIRPDRENDGQYLVVAITMNEVDANLRRLIRTEAIVVGVVLVTLGGLAFWLVRLGLRPLDRIASTANEIAEGDLTRRVADEDQRTEVGQLGHALNTMLGRIEDAFTARQRSEERLRAFVADASHELRTPLTSIKGYSELIRGGGAETADERDIAIRRIEAEATRMGVLVDDLLLLARLDQGRPLERTSVDLTTVVGDAVADCRAVNPERPVQLRVADALQVDGDEGRLRQVVGNLLTNARVHTPPTTPIEVELVRRDGMARIAVVDHGPGVPPDEVDNVFERFARLDPSRTRTSGGTGLGLAIVRAITQAHGGRVDVEPTPGGGATFVVELPAPA
jgi:two-component system OmpR family sensor kinase